MKPIVQILVALIGAFASILAAYFTAKPAAKTTVDELFKQSYRFDIANGHERDLGRFSFCSLSEAYIRTGPPDPKVSSYGAAGCKLTVDGGGKWLLVSSRIDGGDSNCSAICFVPNKN